MKIEFTHTPNLIFAQAYGSDTYGGQAAYGGCVQTAEGCVVSTTTGGAPNTGFLGLSPDAAIASFSGILLIAVAVVGIAYVVFGRIRALKKKSQE